MTSSVREPRAPHAAAEPQPSAKGPREDGHLEALAGRLAQDMAASWLHGAPHRAADVLASHPELSAAPQAAVRLIYEEICLRQEAGEEAGWSDWVRRYPQWRCELETLRDCHSLVAAPQPAAPLPQVGESLGGFQLVAELGRGALGNVYLATQPLLAQRQVVLKVTPSGGREHLLLAALQHTHIVPLYCEQIDPARNLRAFCMPYLGGTTLARILSLLEGQPPVRLAGRDLVAALDQAEAEHGPLLARGGPARHFLEQATYVEAIAWMGACLADALGHVHQRGLVHLDVKPSNVLIAADGQPMLLDFHLARAPMQPGEPPPLEFGGTPQYMSPERRQAWQAADAGRPIPCSVDGRSDLFSLGLVLYQALGGQGPEKGGLPLPKLERVNPQVSVGLADVIRKCLAEDPRARYADAGQLAADLRRHLSALPLRGVRNRSLPERWRKWRRRQPHALGFALMLLAILAAVSAAGLVGWGYLGERFEQAEASLSDGRHELAEGSYESAARTLRRGLDLVSGMPGSGDLGRQLRTELERAEDLERANDLRTVVDRLRILGPLDDLPMLRLREIATGCAELWEARRRLVTLDGPPLNNESDGTVQAELLDLGILWADLRGRLEPVEEGHRQALQILEEAESMFGASAPLWLERQDQAAALGLDDEARADGERAAALPPRSAWEHDALGRWLLARGQFEKAAEHFAQAVELAPGEFWPNFYQAVAAARLGRHDDAIDALRVCIALEPERAECFYNRGLAFDALGQSEEALRDYNRALKLNPAFAAAALNRGVLSYRRAEYAAALNDLRIALTLGANPATVHFNLALVHLAQHEQPAALEDLEQALAHNPDHRESRQLLEELKQSP